MEGLELCRIMMSLQFAAGSAEADIDSAVWPSWLGGAGAGLAAISFMVDVWLWCNNFDHSGFDRSQLTDLSIETIARFAFRLSGTGT